MQYMKSALSPFGLLLLVFLAACSGGKDFAYVPDNEIKPGAGLLSGKDGSFTLIGPGESRKAGEEHKLTGENENSQTVKQ